MSRKKQEALSVTLTNTQELQEFISAEGKVNLIDCHPKWTGPCKSVVTFFKRLKLEVGNPNLRFGVACIDDCHQLDPYKNTKPEPLFLYYASGVLVARIRGCDGPLLTKVTHEILQKEQQIKDGEATRVEISHTEEVPASKSAKAISSIQSIRSSTSGQENSDPNEIKQLAFAVITRDYISNAEEILEDMKSQGIECLTAKQVHLTTEDMQAIIPDLQQRDGWEAFSDYMTSSTSVCLVLTRVGDLGVGVISQMNLLAGPSDQTVAQKDAPDSVNSIYGTMAMYTSSTKEEATGAVARIFPDFVPPVKAKSSTSNTNSSFTNKFLIKTGDNSLFTEEIANNLANCGCKVVGRNDGENVVVLACQRSLSSFRGMVENVQGDSTFEVTDENVDAYLAEE